MRLNYNRIRDIFTTCLYHLLTLTVIFIGFRWWVGESIVPLPEEFSRYDALWYQYIIRIGYFYDPQKQSSVAFFPMFPYLWKGLQLNNYGISILNLLVYYLGFGMLAYAYKFPAKRMLLYLSVPSFMFMYVPYTEALFFLFSVLLLLALRNKNTAAVCFCLLVCSFIRPVATVFLPALIIMEILSSQAQNRAISFRNIGLFCGSVLVGLAGVMFIHYWQTGTALGFIYSQQQWQHYFRLPHFPLSTWGGDRIIQMLDGSALLFGIIAGLKLLQWLAAWLKKLPLPQDKALIFSALYLLGISFAILFFQGGSLQSLNRYFFCTAFFVVFFNYLLETESILPVHFKWIFGGFILFWLLFKSYVNIGAFLKFVLFSAYLLAYLFLQFPGKKTRLIAFILLYAVNCVVQVKLFQAFLHNDWIG